MMRIKVRHMLLAGVAALAASLAIFSTPHDAETSRPRHPRTSR
jgi:hypothetical protein